jgi:hypothetical protein
MEEWKPIDGEENYYISSLGKVKHNDTILQQHLDNGYYRIYFNSKSFKVHRLVGFAFIPNPDNKPFIDHINRIRNDNRVENLRWATNAENVINQDGRTNLNMKHIYLKKDKRNYEYIVVQIRRDKKMVLNKHAKTLEEAVKVRDDYLNNNINASE